MQSEYETFITHWNGRDIEIRWTPDYCAYGDGSVYAHLEIQSTQHGVPHPISETGYRSHFVSPDAVSRMGGPINYVDAWLAEAARSPEWQKVDMAYRQLALI